MNAKHTTKRKTKGKTNWAKVKSLTEKEIITAAKSDPDAKPLTKTQLKKFKRVPTPKEVDYFGCLKNTVTIKKDIVSPLDVKWCVCMNLFLHKA